MSIYAYCFYRFLIMIQLKNKIEIELKHLSGKDFGEI